MLLLSLLTIAAALPQQPWKSLPTSIRTPALCPDTNSTQYTGYVPGSDIFFWFYPSRSDPAKDPIGLWTNGGPGSSGLTGMNTVGPCKIENGKMNRRDWSFNDRASILMIDNPRGVGFSHGDFAAINNSYDGARDAWIFLQSFFRVFPEYLDNDLHMNSVSYGGHYCPAYASFFQHMNLQIAGQRSLWSDVWADRPDENALALNLKSMIVGNGYMNNRVQSKYAIEYGCGGDGSPAVADPAECEWARKELAGAEELMATCRTERECSAAGMYADKISAFPYASTGRNPYNYHVIGPYNETDMIAFYNNQTIQRELGVTGEWVAHSPKVSEAFMVSGDWNEQTDYLFERLLRSGVDILKYEGMVDWICNYLGVRAVMRNLPNYTHQSEWNDLEMKPWKPDGKVAGQYKCLKHGAKMCYVEVDGAGHVISTDKPKEGSLLLGKWMQEREV